MGCINANIGSQYGHLNATIGRVGAGLSATIFTAEEPLRATIGRVDAGLSATISTAEEPLKATIGRVGANINVNIGLICTPNTDVYVRVSPDTLWFFKENEILDVDVISNIHWIVK